MEASQFKAIFLPCHRKLYVVAWHLTRNKEAAEDLIQETFLRLWTRRHLLTDIENPEAYSIMTLHRIFYDVKRIKHIEETENDVSAMQYSGETNDLNDCIEAKDQ